MTHTHKQTHRFLRLVQEDAMYSPGFREKCAECHGEAQRCSPGAGLLMTCLILDRPQTGKCDLHLLL